MIGYRFLSPAEEEMVAAALFYEDASAGLGADFLDCVQFALDRARRYPNSGSPIAQRFRAILLPNFPFSLIYAYESDEIVIVALAHQSRRPNYWLERTD